MSLWQEMTGALLSQVEREWLKDTAGSIAERFDSPLILNIGVYKGASMHCLRAGARDAILVGIDVSKREIQAANVLHAEFIWRDSRRMRWGRPIHLLFVDGGHAYAVVRSDIEIFGKCVVTGGVMAFHDYARSQSYLEEVQRLNPKRPPLGVRRAVDEFCSGARDWEDLGITDSIKAVRRLQGGRR